MPSPTSKKLLWKAERLDLNRWSYDQSVTEAVDELADQLKRSGMIKRITEQRKRAIRVVVVNLYLRWLEDPPGLVAYSRNSSYYSIPKRYNPAGVKYDPVTRVIDGLCSLGYIDKTAKGYYARSGGKSWMSRMAPELKLIDFLEKTCRVDGSMIGINGKAETVILRNSGKQEVDYPDRKYIDTWRKLLTDYNNLLRRKYIDIDLTDYSDPIRINLGNKFVRRIFNNSSFKQGGRFYGGWWQSVLKELRPRILIRSKPTIELDFSGNQIVMAYAVCGIDYFSLSKGDPYSLPKYASTERDAIKKATVIALNAATRRSAESAFRESIKDGECVLPHGKVNKDVFRDIESFHIDIKSQLYVGRAGYYQYLDSQVVEKIVKYFTHIERDPVLCIHDSFIVDEAVKDTLEDQMIEALKDVIRQETKLKSITSDIKDTEAWRSISGPVMFSGTLVDTTKSPGVQRQQEWFRTKRQGVLDYQPPSP